MWWAKRIAVAVSILLVVAICLRFIVAWRISRAIVTAEAEIRSLDGAVTLDGLNAAPRLPDAENAAPIYSRAAEMYRDGVDSFRTSTFDAVPGWFTLRLWLARRCEDEYAPMFELAESAMELSDADWGEYSETDDPYLRVARNLRPLAQQLADNASYRHYQGDDVAAMRRIRNVLHLASASLSRRTLVAQLISYSHYSIASEVIIEISAGLRVDDPQVRRAAEQLVVDLAAIEGTLEARMRSSLLTESAFMRPYYDKWKADSWAVRPLVDRVRLNAYQRQLSVYRGWAVFPAAGGQTVDTRNPFIRSSAKGLVVIRIDGKEVPLLPPTSPELLRQYDWGYVPEEPVRRVFANLRLARAALAVRLYRADNGRWPDGMQSLVPTYLNEVPASPWEPDKPVIFELLKNGHRDGVDRPLICLGDPDHVNILDAPMWAWANVQGSRTHWRDVGVWHDGAWAPAHKESSMPDTSSQLWFGEFVEIEPGFEASGLAPSEHSPRPGDEPEIAE